MKLSSALPVSATFFYHWHTDDTEVGVVVAKAGFGRRPDGRFRALQVPPELAMTESFEPGDPGLAPLLQEQDLAPGKPATDLFLRAIARSPRGKPLPDWEVSVHIPDRLSYAFRVRGPSMWRYVAGGWTIDRPQAVLEVPITYALAYGGAAPGRDGEPPDIYEFNPAGIGHLTPERLKAREPFPAPQIGDLAEFIAADTRQPMTVHGTGPIAKAWLPRREAAGTFDDEWTETRHPRMPRDYSLGFWNAAHPRLVVDPCLRGDEVVLVSGVSHAPDPIPVALPGVGLVLHAGGQEAATESLALTLGTVDIDLRDPDPASHRIDLVWYGLVRQPHRFDQGEIEGTRLKETTP